MGTKARTQERVVDHGATGLRYFQMAADLAELSSALARYCYWNEDEGKWQVISESNETYPQRNVYSTVEGVTATEDEFVLCWFNMAGRGRWEVLKPASATIRTGVLTTSLSQGASASVDEITLNDDNVKVYTGKSYTVWDLKLNVGESIPSGTMIDFVAIGNGKYKWITAYCAESDSLPEE